MFAPCRLCQFSQDCCSTFHSFFSSPSLYPSITYVFAISYIIMRVRLLFSLRQVWYQARFWQQYERCRSMTRVQYAKRASVSRMSLFPIVSLLTADPHLLFFFLSFKTFSSFLFQMKETYTCRLTALANKQPPQTFLFLPFSPLLQKKSSTTRVFSRTSFQLLYQCAKSRR